MDTVSSVEAENSIARHRPARFLLLLVGTFFIAFSAALLLAYCNFGLQTANSNGICDLVQSHVEGAKRITAPKLLFVAGSNVRSGVLAERVGKHFSLPAFNFGLQAALGPRLILFEAQKVLRPGDTAILALEYSQYVDERWNEISSDVLFGCGTEYFRQMSVGERITALLALPSLRLFDAVTFRRSAPESQEHLESPERRAAYVYGDRPLAEYTPTNSETRKRLKLYQPIAIGIESGAAGPQAIRTFVTWARAHGVKVVATWPNTIRFSAYGESEGFAHIREFYRQLGVPVLGTPEGAMYPVDMFYDTQYHLNYEGILQRTADMIALLEANPRVLPSREAPQIFRLGAGQ